MQQYNLILQVDQVDECKMLCFTATSMSRDQKIHLQKSASKLNAKVVEDLLPQGIQCTQL